LVNLPSALPLCPAPKLSQLRDDLGKRLSTHACTEHHTWGWRNRASVGTPRHGYRIVVVKLSCEVWRNVQVVIKTSPTSPDCDFPRSSSSGSGHTPLSAPVSTLDLLFISSFNLISHLCQYGKRKERCCHARAASDEGRGYPQAHPHNRKDGLLWCL
jgi:hypothetical protein